MNLDQKTEVSAVANLAMALGTPRQNPHAGGRAFVLVPQGPDVLKVEYLERPDRPARKTGIIQVSDLESFIAYTLRHISVEETVVYANLNPSGFHAVLNDHASAALIAGWRDHRCSFVLRHSDEFMAWTKANKQQMNQADFAEFIEDNLPDFKAPPGASMHELALNFRAKQEVAYSGAVRMQSGDIELTYTAKTDAGQRPNAVLSGTFRVPEKFTIEIPVWSGLNQAKHLFECRLRYRLHQGAVAFYYELNRPHKVVEEAFELLLTKVKGAVTAPVIFGQPAV